MFCVRCGAELPSDARFCPACGRATQTGPGSAASGDAAVGKRRRSALPWRFVALSWVAALVVAVGVYVGLPRLAPGPETAARLWLRALAMQDTEALVALTCTSGQVVVTNAAALSSGVLGLSASVLGEKPQVNLDDLSYATLSNDGASASVRVSGSLRLTIAGVTAPQPIDQTIGLRYERDAWRVCLRT